MEKLTDEQFKDIEAILELGEKSIETEDPVVRGNKEAAQILGKAIGGDEGKKIAVIAGAADTTAGAYAGILAISGITGFIAGAIISWASLIVPIVPIAMPIIAVSYLARKVFSSDKDKCKSYDIELVKRMQKLQEQVKSLREEVERTSKEKDDIIRDLKEKIAEKELIILAMAKKRQELEPYLALKEGGTYA